MQGVLLINKEKDWTSRDVCNKIRKILHVDSTGHSGTLDPFAEGLLIVTINQANKAIRFFDNDRKTYIASIKLGERTTTGDLTGEINEIKDVPILSKEKVEEVLKSFYGKIKQIPPMTSAVHYQGRKLYELFYEGQEVEREEREVEIFDISLIDFNKDIITFKASVSSGTYIRVLGEDIAKKLSTIGHLISLTRTNIGPFCVDQAIKIGEVDENVKLISISDFLFNVEHVIIKNEMIDKVKNGVKLYFAEAKDDIILLVDTDNTALAIYRRMNEDNLYRCERGLW